MNLSRPFITRPVATTLLALGIALAGLFAFIKLPVSPLPQVDFPTILVQASLPGASPETVATSVTSPLERHLGSIADVAEMTSMSSVGNARIVLQFNLNRDIDGAARDVQAAINAARADLPASLKSNPTYRKVNPADSPIMVVSLTSKTASPAKLYDAASTVLQQSLSQIDGIGQVSLSGSANPAVRVELEPQALFHYGIGLEDVRAALASANANSPKGAIETGPHHYQLYTNDQASKAAQYKDLVIAYRNNAAVSLSDVSSVVDSVEDLRNLGLMNGERAVLVILYRSPGANIIDTIERVKAALPQLTAALPADIQVTPVLDRSRTIRASLADTEHTLLIAVSLVVMVVFLFLRNWRATLIPSVAVPISIVGTFGAMYLLGFSLNNLSLMALIVATGFVVDDAIVVLENIARHIENGTPRLQAAFDGAREVGFTVLSISLSLVAVFLPILLMGGIVGRLFREFALTLSLAIAVSLVVSLTLTPMMCARLLPEAHDPREEGHVARWLERGFEWMQRGYERTLSWALRHPFTVLMTLVATIALNIALYIVVPKGFFPQQDTGLMIGGIQADQTTSFQAMKLKFTEMMRIVRENPNVANVAGFTGGAQTNSGFMFVALKDKPQRKLSADQVIQQLRPRLAEVAGARTFLQAAQDIRAGGRQSNAQYQFTLLGDSTAELYKWAPILTEALQKRPELADVNSDQQQGGLEAMVTIDRATAARLGIKPAQIDNTLYDAFGQRQVSTIYNPLNQYHVVMEVAPQYWQSPEMLKQIYISTSGGSASGAQTTNAAAGTYVAATARASTAGAAAQSAAAIAADSARNQALNSIASSGKSGASSGAAVSTSKSTMVPLSAIASFGPSTTPLAVNHQGLFVATTISFNLPPGVSLSKATQAIYQTMAEAGVPPTIQGSFQGTAQAFQQSLKDQPILILAALAAVYIVLGILYESYIHPVTILSTLPSAGVGALLGLLLFKTEFSIIALIGVILLIGIVKKNAIMMVDFAIDASRQGKSSFDAIHEACLLRFRPIMMTTMAALLGALPLAFGSGDGAEMRAPLGIAIAGGLIVSQMLTLYTTPVVYLYMDRLRVWAEKRRHRRASGGAAVAGE
ncbi:multidrug resistance protein MdtC [Burkholderia thailandensis USAMRU Malaysia |uniref:AcrB/AcrD/AcrF family protein n=1 Tax=Burkholderia thailandensis (strain ATCC 700388 / DSM 13276 / CCUG 48851 / CIP 106301 / E264) TaxID=271848 RepID=Q2SUL9_BURTA|nr:efflux RND transporter permease subunit [Burkholderia thailandensis]ABC39000.1 AcrB/AcrD/AcrF family protein [Burkholderia thailandensis E264]AHI73172.1 multidrug resistance protein MdtC [Burkholderia thailandensis 2002721723]AHI78913.1 multidrug resistance protein MdtC [Burkholderia thailandensis E444]AIC88751.1 multidrug resistance protein MdtC [Burkholderia thailandensis USAMRU Malaysia \